MAIELSQLAFIADSHDSEFSSGDVSQAGVLEYVGIGSPVRAIPVDDGIIHHGPQLITLNSKAADIVTFSVEVMPIIGSPGPAIIAVQPAKYEGGHPDCIV